MGKFPVPTLHSSYKTFSSIKPLFGNHNFFYHSNESPSKRISSFNNSKKGNIRFGSNIHSPKRKLNIILPGNQVVVFNSQNANWTHANQHKIITLKKIGTIKAPRRQNSKREIIKLRKIYSTIYNTKSKTNMKFSS